MSLLLPLLLKQADSGADKRTDERTGLADGLSGRLTQPQWTRRILAVSWTGGVGEERSEGKINNRVTGSDDEPVRSERQ